VLRLRRVDRFRSVDPACGFACVAWVCVSLCPQLDASRFVLTGKSVWHGIGLLIGSMVDPAYGYTIVLTVCAHFPATLVVGSGLGFCNSSPVVVRLLW
jgi:hypothetical protein